MEIIFKGLILAIFTLLIVKVHYSMELEQSRRSRPIFFVRLLISGYAGFLPIPVLRRPDNTAEKILIRKINTTVSLFWGLCLAVMLVLAMSDKLLV